MMRSRRDWLIVVLLVFIVAVSVAGWVSRRGEPSHAVLTPDIVELVRQSESFEGERVRVTGDVRGFALGTPGEHYVLEEAGQYRVEIQGIAPETLAASIDGRMTIEGEFHFKDGVGRYIDVTSWATPSALSVE